MVWRSALEETRGRLASYRRNTIGVMVDWSERGEHIFAKHGITVVEANEALADPNQVVIDPDYNSKNGEGIRIIGFSTSANAVITVIAYIKGGAWTGASAWKSNSRDNRYYLQGGQ